MKPVLDGTVALVTGASSGIGAATAAALATQGAAVAVAARRADRLEELAADIRDQGGTARVLECDITDEQRAADAVERTVAGLSSGAEVPGARSKSGTSACDPDTLEARRAATYGPDLRNLPLVHRGITPQHVALHPPGAAGRER